jgi:hypothetical protein
MERTMGGQRIISQEPKPKGGIQMHTGIRIFNVLAVLWRPISWLGGALILGIIIGVLGNAAFTLLTTGKIDLTGTLTVLSWLPAHFVLSLVILIAVGVLTLCSYLAHRSQQQITEEAKQAHDESLVIVAQGVKHLLEERNARPIVSSIPSSPISQKAIPPNSIWNIPYHRNPFFTGRETLLTLLHDSLTANKAAALTQAQAISGLGGIGKTQVAIEYAYHYQQEYTALLWASAASHESLILDFVALASVLNLPEQEAQDQTITIAAVKHWLVTHDSWLLVLDNADELEVVSEFLPPTSKGHVLITTRTQATGSIARSIEVDEMNPDEGTLLLLRRAKLLAPDAALEQASPQDRRDAYAIVHALYGLPLAVDQAGAYIEETGCTLASYHEQYQRRQLVLLQRRGGTGREHPEAVATTWSLSFEQVERRNPTAADLLRVCAYLSPEAIPLDMLAAGASQLGLLLSACADDPTLLDEPIAVLRRYSLLRRHTEDNTLSIHRLVQAIIKATMTSETQHEWAERTVRAVNAAFPEVEVDTWPQCKRYLPHAQACADLIGQYILAFPQAARLLNQAAWYLVQVGANSFQACAHPKASHLASGMGCTCGSLY